LKTCGYAVSLEPRAHGTIQFRHGLKRPDLAYTKAGRTAFMDVVVAEPTAASCRNDGLHSPLLQGNGAAIIAELRKNEEYRNMPPDPFRFGVYWTNRTRCPGIPQHCLCRPTSSPQDVYLGPQYLPVRPPCLVASSVLLGAGLRHPGQLRIVSSCSRATYTSYTNDPKGIVLYNNNYAIVLKYGTL
jgi:hypothetical protein